MAALEHIIRETSISDAITLVRNLDYHSLSALTNTSSIESSELEQQLTDNSSSTITYSVNPEVTAQTASIDYEQLWYGDQKTTPASFALDDDYWSTSAVVDVQSEMINDEEAQKTIVDIQYAAVLGNSMEINSEERRRLNLWIMFNPAQFKMAESMYAVTSNVDYRPLV